MSVDWVRPNGLHQPQAGASTDSMDWESYVLASGLEDRPDPACRAACGVGPRSGEETVQGGSPALREPTGQVPSASPGRRPRALWQIPVRPVHQDPSCRA
jgi:hypothetical protein